MSKKRCRAEGLPPSVVLYEDPDHGHTITEAMLARLFDLLSETL